MKRKLTVFVICALAAVVVVIVFRNGNEGKRPSGTQRTLVVTQDGKITLIAEPQSAANLSVTVEQPKNPTNNTAPPVVKPADK
jgi:hypothetical protein